MGNDTGRHQQYSNDEIHYHRTRHGEQWDDDDAYSAKYQYSVTDDDRFFQQLEYVHQFEPGVLLSFYNLVCDAYHYELPSLEENLTVHREVEIFACRFLPYLLAPLHSSEEATSVQLHESPLSRTYPRILYTRRIDSEEPCRPLDDTQQVYMVNRRLDFIYAYIIEKAIVDTLKRRVFPYRRKEVITRSYIDQLELLQEEYRTRVNSRYIQGPPPSHDGSNNMADTWVIYARRSSPFFTQCMQTLGQNNMGFHYSEESLHIEAIPFQQVLLLCGNYPGFAEKHFTSQTEVSLDVAIVDADDWLSMPMWLSLLCPKIKD